MPLTIGKCGQIQEWPEDYDEVEPGHRHISHLFALFPGDQITPHKTPELAKAARATIERRLANGGGGTGWSRAWIINFWTRLADGEKAYRESDWRCSPGPRCPTCSTITRRFRSTATSAGRPPSPRCWCKATLARLQFLPALPKAWSSGKVTGLRARGGVELDLTWSGGLPATATLRPTVDGVHVLRLADGQPHP